MRHTYLWTFLREVLSWRGSTSAAVLLFVLTNLAVTRWQKSLEAEHRRNLLAPAATSGRVRHDVSTGGDLARYWPSIPDARLQRVVILSGMSQMYSINERREGDQTISEWMDDSLALKGTRVFGLAAPNLTNEEALFLLLAAASEPATRPRAFVFGVCFDKFRNVDLRSGYRDFLRTRRSVETAWTETARQWAGRYPLAANKMLASLAEATAAKPEDRSIEARLRKSVGNVLPVVKSREVLNANVQLQVFLLRNWIFQIKPTSKRPIIQSRYEMNCEFIGLMSDVARANNIELILYVIPLNPQGENPYIAEQYGAFKTWLETFAQDRGLAFANLEGLVPAEEWGVFMGGPDFKHFKGVGHRRTAEALVSIFGARLTGDK